MKEICIITNYYPPETGAAANRISLLAECLKDKGFNVTIVCPLPNYPKGKIFKPYNGKIFYKESINGITVFRLWMYATNATSKWKRLLSMFSFSVSLCMYKIFKKAPKLILIQSPPLLIAHIAIRLFSRKRKVVLNVSDLWPLSGQTLGVLQSGFYYKTLEAIEHYNYNHADVILGQSQNIVSYIKQIAPHKNMLVYRNYPKPTIPHVEVNLSMQTIKIIYAGLLGVAQGILELCEQLELPPHIEFHIFGSGTEDQALKKYIENKPSIYYHGNVSKEILTKAYANYHLAIVPLKTAIYGAVPSKIFELAYNGIPMLYMAGGEGEQIVIENKLGYCIKPRDYTALNAYLKTVSAEYLILQRQQIRTHALATFSQEKQINMLLPMVLD